MDVLDYLRGAQAAGLNLGLWWEDSHRFRPLAPEALVVYSCALCGKRTYRPLFGGEVRLLSGPDCPHPHMTGISGPVAEIRLTPELRALAKEAL